MMTRADRIIDESSTSLTTSHDASCTHGNRDVSIRLNGKHLASSMSFLGKSRLTIRDTSMIGTA